MLTTFATLGTEFANQRTWVQDDKDASSGSDDNHSDDEDDFQVVDALGRPIDVSGKQKKNKKKRKRQHEGTKEAPNALQRVEWFRVVLDEAQ